MVREPSLTYAKSMTMRIATVRRRGHHGLGRA
jgi:hypothetical protein